MKLQNFPTLTIGYGGPLVVWRQGYHRHISGQSVHVANTGRQWDSNLELSDAWTAYDDDSGIMLVTASTMRESIARCEEYVAKHSALFVSDEYVAICKVFLALRKEAVNED